MSDSDKKKIIWGSSDVLNNLSTNTPELRVFIKDRLERPAARGNLFDFAMAQMQFNLELISSLVALAGADEDAKKAKLSQTLELLDDFQKGLQSRLIGMLMEEVYTAPAGEDVA